MSGHESSQHKPVFTGHEHGFADDGRPVQVYHPPAPTLALQLVDDLREAGAVVPDDATALAAIESALDRAGDERAAEALGRILDKLGPDSAAGIQLRRLMDGQLVQSPKAKVSRWLDRFKRSHPVNTSCG